MRRPTRRRNQEPFVPRLISFVLLFAILLLIGSAFFEVMMQFAVPLFLAAVLVVVFKPMHQRLRRQIPGRPRLAALTTTLIILLIVLAPTTWLGWRAYLECARVVHHLNELRTPASAPDGGGQTPANTQSAPTSSAPPANTSTATPVAPNNPSASPASGDRPQGDAQQEEAAPNALAGPVKLIKERFKRLTGIELQIDALFENAAGYIGGTLITSAKALFSVVVGLAIMVLAVYYFLADGPAMVRTAMRLSPLEDEYEQELLDKFANVSRAVVVASLASAVVQGGLAGVGYYFALPEGAPLALLTMLTMALAIVPFIGAAAIWAPTAAWIYLAGGEAGDPNATMRAVLLAAYGVGVVSMADNIIKPFVLHGQSNMHPLWALISVLGGVQVLGPVGILVGPMLVAFVQAVLSMLNKELKAMGDAGAATKKGEPGAVANIHPALMAEAEAVVAENVGLLDQISAVTAVPIPDSGTPSNSHKSGKEKPPKAGAS
jgi:predicted PurR-regulated permease PerM